MPSKGIDCYSYISAKLAARYEVRFEVPEDGFTSSSSDNFTKRHLEVASTNINGREHLVDLHGFGHVVGRFQWTAYRDGVGVASAFNNINALTGNVAVGGTMLSTQQLLPIKTEDAIITYGFYDAGRGIAGLTNHDQCYVTIAPLALQSWLGVIAAPGSNEETQPFSRLCLVCPHDNGMNLMQNVDLVVQSLDEGAVEDLKQYLPHLQFFSHIPNSVLIHMLPDIVYGVAITQKKTITMMLELGARYFEFRPAYLLPMFEKSSHLENKLYFQHACIPGIAFDDFLQEQVRFLDSHPTEICVLHIRYDNIPSACRRPTNEELDNLLDEACSRATNGHLTWAAPQLIHESIAALREAGRRLIVFREADKYDSYSHEAYATLTAEPILKQFENMTAEAQTQDGAGDLTIMQCQATSQSIKEVLVYSVLASNAATSCLTSTKADLDRQTLPWLRANMNQRLHAEGKLCVVLNDFVDGATTETGVELSKERLMWP